LLLHQKFGCVEAAVAHNLLSTTLSSLAIIIHQPQSVTEPEAIGMAAWVVGQALQHYAFKVSCGNVEA